MPFTRDEISASNAEVYDFPAPATMEALKSVLVLCRFVSTRRPLEKLFSAGSVMRLHKKIFHDTKTLLSEAFFSISTQPPQPPHPATTYKKNNLELRVRKTFVQLNRRKINFPSQPFLKRQTSFSANNSLIILFVS